MSGEERLGLAILPFATEESWLAWLKDNHLASAGVWIKFAKKGSGIPSVTYEQARDGAIRYGWIDGLKHAYDAGYYLIRFTPRRPKSGWSRVNTKIAEDLMARGLMAPAGLAQVEAAKRDGRWEAAYDSPASMTVPEDFLRELERHPGAGEFFRSLNASNRYAFLYRIQTARTPDSRAERIGRFVEMLEKGEAFHPVLGKSVDGDTV